MGEIDARLLEGLGVRELARWGEEVIISSWTG